MNDNTKEASLFIGIFFFGVPLFIWVLAQIHYYIDQQYKLQRIDAYKNSVIEIVERGKQ